VDFDLHLTGARLKRLFFDQGERIDVKSGDLPLLQSCPPEGLQFVIWIRSACGQDAIWRL
jgi:hypothetical protein